MNNQKMKKLTPDEILKSLTFITNFICDKSMNFKTFEELVIIFEKCYKTLSPNDDPSNDLRILEFEKKMNLGQWSKPVILIKDSHNQRIIDGIHRGVAYLRCVNNNNSERLPDIYELTRNNN